MSTHVSGSTTETSRWLVATPNILPAYASQLTASGSRAGVEPDEIRRAATADRFEKTVRVSLSARYTSP